MGRISLGFSATFGIVLGTLFIGQQGKAEDGVGSNPAPGKASSTSAATAGQQKRAATTDESETMPLSDVGSRRPSGTFGGRQTTGTALPAEPLTVLKSGPDHTRVVHRLKTPVTDIDRTIKQLLHLEGELHNSGGTATKTAPGPRVAIASSVVNNSLVISGPPDAVEEVLRLVEKLDHSAGLILLEMEMGESPIGAAKPGEGAKGDGKSTTTAAPSAFRLLDRPAKMETTARARLTTLDNQPAFVQMGARVPRVTGLTTSPANGRFRPTSMTSLNVGLIVGMTPRTSPDGTVAMQISVEQSQLDPENEDTPVSIAGDKVVRSPRIDTTTVQTTVAIPDGKTIILGSVARQGENEKELVILVTPHILGLEEAKNTPIFDERFEDGQNKSPNRPPTGTATVAAGTIATDAASSADEPIQLLKELAFRESAFRRFLDPKGLEKLSVTKEQKEALRLLHQECHDLFCKWDQERINETSRVLNPQQQARLREQALGPLGPEDGLTPVAIHIQGEAKPVHVYSLEPYPDFSRPAVRTELSLTAAQEQQVRDILGNSADLAEGLAREAEKLSPQERKTLPHGVTLRSHGWGGKFSPEEIAKMEEKLIAERKQRRAEVAEQPMTKPSVALRKQFEAVLAPKQLALYRELAVRNFADRAMNDRLLQRLIGASEQQKAELGRFSHDDVAKIRQGFREMGEKLLRILTPAQQEILRAEIEASTEQQRIASPKAIPPATPATGPLIPRESQRVAEIEVWERKKGQAKVRLAQPNLAYLVGYDATFVAGGAPLRLEITVRSLPGNKPIQHVIEARLIRDPEGEKPVTLTTPKLTLTDGETGSVVATGADGSELGMKATISSALAAATVIETTPGDKFFSHGDSITITEVKATSPDLKAGDKVIVKGHYALSSKPKASLCLFQTATRGSGKGTIRPGQRLAVMKGEGEYELSETLEEDGYLHVTFYSVPQGTPFGGMYFGTAKQMKEMGRQDLQSWYTAGIDTSTVGEKMAEAVRKVKSYKSTAHVKHTVDFPKPGRPAVSELIFTTYVQLPGAVREDGTYPHSRWKGPGPEETEIAPAGKPIISIHHPTKTFQRYPFPRNGPLSSPFDRLEDLGEFSGKADVQLGTREINGKKADGFQIDVKKIHPDARGDMAEIWLDRSSSLPVFVRYKTRHLDSSTTVEYSDIQWNIDLDPKLFDPTPPEGYKDATPKPLALEDKVREIIDALTIYAQASGGRYPPSEVIAYYYTTEDLCRLLGVREFPGGKKEGNAGKAAKAIPGFKQMNEIQAYNPDAAYYGKTVGPKDKDKVLFRWKLDDGRYEVIFGDLRNETVTAEELRALEGK